MTSYTSDICRKIAEGIVDNGGVFIHPSFRPSESPGDREYLVRCMTEILSTKTALPKMVELLHLCQSVRDYATEILAELQGEPTKQIGAGK